MAATLLASATLSAGVLTACESNRHVPIAETEIRERTTPSDAQTVSSSAASRTPFTVETTWEFTTGMTWSDYLAWVKPRLLGFKLQADSATSATFVRVEGGDSFTLVIEQVGLQPGLHARLTWRAGPA